MTIDVLGVAIAPLGPANEWLESHGRGWGLELDRDLRAPTSTALEIEVAHARDIIDFDGSGN